MAYQAKTVQHDGSVEEFLASVDNKGRVEDARLVMEIMERVTGLPPKMWGPSLIGFDSYDYVYDTGHSGTSFITGVGARKANLVVYVMPGFAKLEAELAALGKHKLGKCCLYLGRLKGLNLDALERIIRFGVEDMRARYHGK